MSRVLVTGGAGFIGRHLTAALIERGDEVSIIDSMEPQAEPEAPPEAALYRAAVGNRDMLKLALRDVDRVVHLAALVGVGQSMYQSERYVRANVLDTITLMSELRNRDIRRLVVASSMSCYGEGRVMCPNCGNSRGKGRSAQQLADGNWDAQCEVCGAPASPLGIGERDALRPTSVYAISKRDQEEYCLSLGDALGIPTMALRFFNVYGPGQALSNPYTGVAAIFACRLLNDKPPVLFEDGNQVRDFVHVDDIVRGILAALDSQATGAVNLGTGQPTSVRTVALTLAKALERCVPPVLKPIYRVGDVRNCYALVDEAKFVLDWQARVDPQRGLTELAGWLQDAAPTDSFARATAELETAGLLR